MTQKREPIIYDPDVVLDEIEARHARAASLWGNALDIAMHRTRQKFPSEAFDMRLERALDLVVSGKLEYDACGRLWVGSQSRPGTAYLVDPNRPCRCEDAKHGSPPNGFCKHRLAAYLHAQVMQISEEIMAESDETPQGRPEPQASADVTPLHYQVATPPARCTLKWRDASGLELLMTLEDASDAGLMRRINHVRPTIHQQIEQASLKGVAQPGTERGGKAGGNSAPKPYCGKHKNRYFRNDDGSYSHRMQDGSRCMARPEQAARWT